MPILDSLATFTTADGRAISTTATCDRNGIAQAQATASADLRVSMLGNAAVSLAVAGNTGTASISQLTLLNLTRVTASIQVTRTTTTSGAPNTPTASSRLAVTIGLTVEERALLIGPWTTALGLTITATLVTADCTLVLPT